MGARFGDRREAYADEESLGSHRDALHGRGDVHGSMLHGASLDRISSPSGGGLLESFPLNTVRNTLLARRQGSVWVSSLPQSLGFGTAD